MTDKATVEYLAQAEVGDMVWVFDAERGHYVDRVYQGRGVWLLAKVTETNKASVSAWGGKFDRKTGYARFSGGWASRNVAAGQSEYEARLWISENKRSLVDAVSAVNDIDVLKAIADLIGFKHG